MTYDATETTTEYAATRVQLQTNARFESLVASFEQAVPELADADAVAD